MARIGDSENYVGAKLVASWHLRNLEMFANLTRLIEGPNERIVVLDVGQTLAPRIRPFPTGRIVFAHFPGISCLASFISSLRDKGSLCLF